MQDLTPYGPVVIRSSTRRGQPMKRRLGIIFAVVLQVAIQIIGAADVMGADDALQPLITTSDSSLDKIVSLLGLQNKATTQNGLSTSSRQLQYRNARSDPVLPLL